LTFDAELALKHASAHLAELFETLGLEPLASLAQGRAPSTSFLCTSEAEVSVIFFCAWDKPSAMEYGLSFASLAFNANHTAGRLIGRTL